MNARLLLSLLLLGAAPVSALAHGGAAGESSAATSAAPAERPAHAAALGRPGDKGKVTRTIEIVSGDDMRYRPDRIEIKRGETVRFLIRNAGTLKHEMVIGTLAELRKHAEVMRRFPEMEHDDPNAAQVGPGQTGEIAWHFTRVGTFDFACLMPGHFEAGMKGTIVVRK